MEKIFYKAVTTNIKTLASMNVWTSPEYQRQSGAWTIEAKSYLIETTISNLLIPPLFFSYKQNTYQMIDGLQRYTSIIEFINNQFALTFTNNYEGTLYWDENLKQYHKIDLSGCKFKDLNDDIQALINNYSITYYYFENVTPIQIQDIFNRLNNGIALTYYEKLNGLYTNLDYWQTIKNFINDTDQYGNKTHMLWDDSKVFFKNFNGERTATQSFWTMIFFIVHSTPLKHIETMNFIENTDYAKHVEQYVNSYNNLHPSEKNLERSYVQEISKTLSEAFIPFKEVYEKLKEKKSYINKKISFDNINHILPIFLLFVHLVHNNISIDLTYVYNKLYNVYFNVGSPIYSNYQRTNGNSFKQRQARFQILLDYFFNC